LRDPNEAAQRGQIDFYIRPLVQAFNQIDQVMTIASCHGHHGREAYVYFKSPIAFAEDLERRLFQAFHFDQALRYEWTMRGVFHPDLGLCISLRASRKKFNRAKLNQDFQWLIAALANSGPEVAR
jgi:hypothetical protein